MRGKGCDAYIFTHRCGKKPPQDRRKISSKGETGLAGRRAGSTGAEVKVVRLRGHTQLLKKPLTLPARAARRKKEQE